MAGQHFKEDDSKREDIAPCIHFAPLNLLGRHIRQCSYRARRLGQLQGSLQLCQSKVHHLDLVLRVDHDIVCFDIAMDDPVLVSLLEGFADLDGVADGILLLLDRNHFRQGLTIHVFHHDELLSRVSGVTFAGYIVDRADVGMIERCSGLSFLQEACLFRLVGFKSPWEKLQSDRAFELDVFSAVDNAHSAFTKLLQNSVM